MAQEYGGSDRLTPEQRKKLKRRTTASSKKRLRDRFRENDRPQNGSAGGGNPSPAKPPGPLQQRADQITDLRYAPVESSLNQRGLAIPSWFENYRTQIGQQQQASQQYAAPIVQQAQTNAQQAGQVAPGVDPNTPAGQDAQLAAAARAALGNAFVSTLQGFGQVQNQYMEGRKTVASTAEVGEQSQLARDRTDTAREKGLYRATTLGELKDKRHTQRLENAAFGLDTYEAETDRANTAADNDRADKQDRQKNRTPNQWGYSTKEWNGFTPEKRRRIMKQVKAEQRAPGSDGTQSPAEMRKQREKRGTGINRVREVGSLFDEYSSGQVKVPGPNGTETTRAPTESEIRARLRKEGYSQSEITIGLKVRRSKPLTPSEIATARRMGIWPVPKAWTRRAPLNRPGNAPAEGGNRPT